MGVYSSGRLQDRQFCGCILKISSVKLSIVPYYQSFFFSVSYDL